MSTIVESQQLYERNEISENSDNFDSNSVPIKKKKYDNMNVADNNLFSACTKSNVAGTNSCSTADTSSYDTAGASFSSIGGACSPVTNNVSKPCTKNSVSTRASSENGKRKKKSQTNMLDSIENCWEKFSMLLSDKSKIDENSDITFGKLVGYELNNIEDKNKKCSKKREILMILYDSE